MSIFLACLWSQHNSIDNVHRLVKHQNTHGGFGKCKAEPVQLKKRALFVGSILPVLLSIVWLHFDLPSTLLPN